MRFYGETTAPHERALKRDDTFAYSPARGEHAHSNLGIVLMDRGEYAEAEHHFKRATTLHHPVDTHRRRVIRGRGTRSRSAGPGLGLPV